MIFQIFQNFKNDPLNLDGQKILTFLNKTKIAMSNDDTRHYLNGIFIHPTASNKNFLFDRCS